MHQVSTLHYVTRRAIKACIDCDCAACKSSAESLERLLLEPADVHKLLDAAMVRDRNARPGGARGGVGIGIHPHIASLVCNLELAWLFAASEPNDETVSSVIEHLRDAWWSLMAHKINLRIEDATAS